MYTMHLCAFHGCLEQKGEMHVNYFNTKDGKILLEIDFD